MLGKTKKHWDELVAKAATEQDVDKFLELHRQILELLEQKERRLRSDASTAGIKMAERNPLS